MERDDSAVMIKVNFNVSHGVGYLVFGIWYLVFGKVFRGLVGWLVFEKFGSPSS